MESNKFVFRNGIQRPRSLCENKLLSVQTPAVHQFVRYNNGRPVTALTGHQHQQQQQSIGLQQMLAVSKYRNGSLPNVSRNHVDQHETSVLRAPSMAGLMNTTVPQRLVVRPLGRQHTPTRNSLRHSRMICLSQQGKVPRKYLPPVIHHYKTGCCLIGACFLLGAILISLGFYLLLWSPELGLLNCPYWSGGALMLTSISGLILLCCCRKKYPGMKGGCCVFVVRVQYIVTNACIAILAAAATLCACVFASVHVSHLAVMDCQPPANINVTTLSLFSQGRELANASCLCIGGHDDNQIYNYDPLTCRETTKLLPVLLMASAIINGLACLTSSCYVVLLWSNRLPYMYAGLKTPGQKSNAALKSLYQ